MYSWKCEGHGPTSPDMVKGEILSSLHLQSNVWAVAVSHWHYGPPPNTFPPRMALVKLMDQNYQKEDF